MIRRLLVSTAVFVGSAACASNNNPAVSVPPSAGAVTASPAGAIRVTSSAFKANETIPVKYSCQGQNVAPQLQWSGVPSGAKELALVMFDPDARGGAGFLHWVAFKIPPATSAFAENTVPTGVRQAKGGAGKAGYIGPCPPAGPAHHYEFTVWALRDSIDLPDGAPGDDVRAQLSGKSIAKGTLVGLYARR